MFEYYPQILFIAMGIHGCFILKKSDPFKRHFYQTSPVRKYTQKNYKISKSPEEEKNTQIKHKQN